MRGPQSSPANPLRSPPWVAAALFFALLVRMLVPTGYMPVVDADQRVRIEMCTPAGAVTVWRTERNRDADPHHQPARTDPCPFALNAHAGDLPPPVLIAARLTAAVFPAPFAVQEDWRVTGSLFAPPPPARAPPQSRL